MRLAVDLAPGDEAVIVLDEQGLRVLIQAQVWSTRPSYATLVGQTAAVAHRLRTGHPPLRPDVAHGHLNV
jgi:hypothetical protein